MKQNHKIHVKRKFENLGNMSRVWIGKVMLRGREAVTNEEGMGTIELVLLICVLIALALMFKDTIVEFVEEILGNISSQETVFDPGAIAK